MTVNKEKDNKEKDNKEPVNKEPVNKEPVNKEKDVTPEKKPRKIVTTKRTAMQMEDVKKDIRKMFLGRKRRDEILDFIMKKYDLSQPRVDDYIKMIKHEYQSLLNEDKERFYEANINKLVNIIDGNMKKNPNVSIAGIKELNRMCGIDVVDVNVKGNLSIDKKFVDEIRSVFSGKFNR